MTTDRYKVSAVPVGGGERVTGYYLYAPQLGDAPERHEILNLDRTQNPYAFTCVEPATIEPVMAAPKPTDSGVYHICPNCDRLLRKCEPLHGKNVIPFCKWCGQALDWDAVTP